ncbi:hypothetical protein MRS76_17050 [Rhizobiaceae bacterium n13]|uniref:Uncharacterized protein n=1 Tax=Ferirhizobium litorale TaxID=2927786 RepID=A0AAE3U358_9HYPH|nr:hypothetical protein [Fererhizobium litorale]MDI7863663.1 hypothetical protein [Fererhizobium litorale]MDI7923367.1 hypothetical protein [Fererhizobium litorale]
MDDDRHPAHDDKALAQHILPNSGTMIGVCITLIGLVKVAEGHLGPSIVDELAALVSLLFLASALASYLAMRAAVRAQVSRHLELAADQTFLGGLVSLVAIGMFFAYEII